MRSFYLRKSLHCGDELAGDGCIGIAQAEAEEIQETVEKYNCPDIITWES